MTDRYKEITRKILFVAACVLLNMAGDKIADIFELPFWLDTMGTALSACCLGPVFGAAVGLMSNVIFGIGDGFSAVYSLVNVGIGFIIGIFAKKDMLNDVFSVLFASVITGLFTVICSVPINIIIADGYTNNKWGDALFELLSIYHINTWLKSACAQAFLDIPDKVICLLSAYGILSLMKKRKSAKKSSDENNS
ncbi:MAG: hypothetical protein LUI05_09290 [Oscillospiraceae bacterium]|nr:hypothetical protein [Oscillospiraceae bacterium]